jgi:hypothetical protein
MKFFVSIILTALISFAGALFFPWWIIAVAAFIVAIIIHQKAIRSFVSAFLALFVLWAGQSLYMDAQNEHLLSKKVASILPLAGSPMAVIFVAAFIGGLVAGMAALTASFLRSSSEN